MKTPDLSEAFASCDFFIAPALSRSAGQRFVRLIRHVLNALYAPPTASFNAAA